MGIRSHKKLFFQEKIAFQYLLTLLTKTLEKENPVSPCYIRIYGKSLEATTGFEGCRFQKSLKIKERKRSVCVADPSADPLLNEK